MLLTALLLALTACGTRMTCDKGQGLHGGECIDLDTSDGLTDADGDGVPSSSDCNDGDPAIYPGAPEVDCDGVNNDCDGQVDEDAGLAYADNDGDGYGDDEVFESVCSAPDEWVEGGGDCDDGDDDVHSGAVERCDDIDNDCDGLVDDEDDVPNSQLFSWYGDGDGDGYGDGNDEVRACVAPEGHIDQAGDCDDSDAEVSPAGEEWFGDGIDQDCSGEADDGCGEIEREWVEYVSEPAPMPDGVEIGPGKTVEIGRISGEGAVCALGDGFHGEGASERFYFGRSGCAWDFSDDVPDPPFELGDLGELTLCYASTDGVKHDDERLGLARVDLETGPWGAAMVWVE